MNLFEANLVQYGDRAGLGAYEVGHFLQHQQYLAILAGQGFFIPDYNILHMQTLNPDGSFNEFEFNTWLNTHETIHELLRGAARVNGPFAAMPYFDPKSPEEFEVWQENHRAEHALFDHHFGTT